jgi:outer membrane murein-binding lipoprotein Lpp
MPFTADDLRELVTRLHGDPDSRREMRELLRDPALERIESVLTDLAQAQRRTEERLAALSEHVDRQGEMLTARIDQLTVRLDQLTARVDQLTVRVDRLTEQMQALTARVDQLTEQMKVLTSRVDLLTVRVDQLFEAQARTEATLARIADRLGGLVGESLERRYRERAAAYFGRVLRKTRVLDSATIEDALADRLSADEMYDTLLTDVVVCGKPQSRPDVEEVWLAVEVSSVVDRDDVDLAVRRGKLLARAGRPVVPVVAGEKIITVADEAARTERVAVLEDGRVANWDEALAAALGAA